MNSRIPIIAIAVCAAASISCGVALLKSPDMRGNTDTASVYILGPARSLLAQGLYERADIYFHKGAPRFKEQAFENSLYQRWKQAIVPTKHAHTEGNETAEILPWLRLAAQSDPNNVEIFLVASYWLVTDCGRPDLASQAIAEAREKNPHRYELPLEQARIDLSQSQFGEALASLNESFKLLLEHQPEDREQAMIDLKFILSAASYLHEVAGQHDECILSTRELVKISPTQANHDRLARLESGNFDPAVAQERLTALFHREHECDYEHEHGPECGCTDHDHDENHVHGSDHDH